MIISKKVPPRLEIIPKFISELLKQINLPYLNDDKVFDISLCLEEALINAIKHGNRLNPNLSIEVKAEVLDEKLIFEIKDQGQGFDYSKLPDPTTDDNLNKPQGRGLFLIKKLMDSVEFLNRGRTIRMVKILKKGVKVNIKEETINDVMIFTLEGEININTSPDLRKKFNDITDKKQKKVLVDFSGVNYIDSSGLATLIEVLQRLKKIGGGLRFSNMSEKVKNIFQITKLVKLFQIYNDRRQALEGF